MPKLYLLDNEAPLELKAETNYHLVPIHIHRRNFAERAIRKWKNIFLSGLASTDTKLPASEYDFIIPQTVPNLNIFRN